MTNAEKILTYIMAVLGPSGACDDTCLGCKTETMEVLVMVHRYFGNKKAKKIYKDLNYVVPKRLLGY